MDTLVANVLQIDSDNRVPGQGEVDLWGLEDLRPDEWDYSLPTLVANEEVGSERPKNLNEFRQMFEEVFPFRIDMTNVLVAGGCPASILNHAGRYRARMDVDLFVYGLGTTAEATSRVRQILTELETSYKARLVAEHEKQVAATRASKAGGNNHGRWNPEPQPTPVLEEKFEPEYVVQLIRSRNAITVQLDDKYTIQIILRLYASKSEILHGFDLGSSAVGWDGTHLYFTTLSKFSHEYNVNILDPTRRSTTYEKRLVKYFERGFEIILPSLDISRLRTTNLKHGIPEVADLPHFSLSYDRLTDRKIHLHRFLFDEHSGPQGATSDYQLEDLDEHRVFYINLHRLAKDSPPEDYYFIEQGGNLHFSSILDARPTMSRRRVINYYDELKQRVNKGRSLTLGTLRTYMKDLKQLGDMLGDEKADIDALVLSLIESEKQRVLKLVAKVANPSASFPLVWRTENPGSQLTGSFNPIMANPQDWYGSLFIPFN